MIDRPARSHCASLFALNVRESFEYLCRSPTKLLGLNFVDSRAWLLETKIEFRWTTTPLHLVTNAPKSGRTFITRFYGLFHTFSQR